ncbi:hypothetical protein BSLA_03r0714 [Burkholderia stabilis]|nr:hypothetical protein BSLA_03r0714 [Burkholderia stabilis]
MPPYGKRTRKLKWSFNRRATPGGCHMEFYTPKGDLLVPTHASHRAGLS